MIPTGESTSGTFPSRLFSGHPKKNLPTSLLVGGIDIHLKSLSAATGRLIFIQVEQLLGSAYRAESFPTGRIGYLTLPANNPYDQVGFCRIYGRRIHFKVDTLVDRLRTEREFRQSLLPTRTIAA